MFGSLQIWSKYTLHASSSHSNTRSYICVGIEIKGSSNIINYFTIDNLTFTTTETKRRVWKTFPERTVRLCLWGIPNMVYKGFLWQILHLHSSTCSHEKCEINLWVRVFSSKSSWRLLRHHLLQGCDLRHHISFPGHLTEKYFDKSQNTKKNHKLDLDKYKLVKSPFPIVPARALRSPPRQVWLPRPRCLAVSFWKKYNQTICAKTGWENLLQRINQRLDQ